MKTIAFITGICLMMLLLPVLAFSGPFLTCDPQPHADSYNIFLGGNQIATSEAVLDTENGLYYLYFDLASLGLTDGDYIATATAQNEWGVSGLSNECPFTKVVPANPLGLRVSSE